MKSMISLVAGLLMAISLQSVAQSTCPKGEKRLHPTEECIPAVLFNYLYCLEKSGGGKVEIKNKASDEKTKSLEIGLAGTANGVVLKGQANTGYNQKDAEKVVREIEEKIDSSLASKCQAIVKSMVFSGPFFKPPRVDKFIPVASANSDSLGAGDSGFAKFGRCRSDYGMLKGRPTFDAAVMLDQWPVPMVWIAGQADILIPITNENSFLNYKTYELEGAGATAASKRSPSEDMFRLLNIDSESRKVVLREMEGFSWGAHYYAKFGLVKTYPRHPDGEMRDPFFDVRFLSEWVREMFNKSMALDYYSRSKKYCKEEGGWLSAPEITFPSILFGEFILVTRDGQAIYRLKTPGKDRSHLAEIQNKIILTVSAETSIRVDSVESGGDMLFDRNNPARADINLNKLVTRAVKNDIGIDRDLVTKFRVFGVALQTDTLNSAIVGIVYTSLTCEEVIAQAFQKELSVFCMSPQLGQEALKGKGERILVDDSKFAWHSTSRLRIHLWQGM